MFDFLFFLPEAYEVVITEGYRNAWLNRASLCLPTLVKTKRLLKWRAIKNKHLLWQKAREKYWQKNADYVIT